MCVCVCSKGSLSVGRAAADRGGQVEERLRDLHLVHPLLPLLLLLVLLLLLGPALAPLLVTARANSRRTGCASAARCVRGWPPRWGQQRWCRRRAFKLLRSRLLPCTAAARERTCVSTVEKKKLAHTSTTGCASLPRLASGRLNGGRAVVSAHRAGGRVALVEAARHGCARGRPERRRRGLPLSARRREHETRARRESVWRLVTATRGALGALDGLPDAPPPPLGEKLLRRAFATRGARRHGQRTATCAPVRALRGTTGASMVAPDASLAASLRAAFGKFPTRRAR